MTGNSYNIGNYIKEEDLGTIDLSKTKSGNYLEKVRQADNRIFNKDKSLTKEEMSDKLVGRSQKYKYKDVNWDGVGKRLQELTQYMRTKTEQIYTDKDFKELKIIDEIEKFKRYFSNEGMKASSIKKEDYLKKEGDHYELKIDDNNLNNYIIKMDGSFYSSRHLNSVDGTIHDEFPGELQINLESKTGKSFTSSTIPDVRLLYPYDILNNVGGINPLEHDGAQFLQINTTQAQLFLNRAQKDIMKFLPKTREINLANCFFGTDKQLTKLLGNLLYCLKYPTDENGRAYDNNFNNTNVANDIRYILNDLKNEMGHDNNSDLLYNNFINLSEGSNLNDSINQNDCLGKAGFTLFSKILESANALTANNFPLCTASRINVINNADTDTVNQANFKYLYCDNNSVTKERTIFPNGDNDDQINDKNQRTLFPFGDLPDGGDYVKGYDTVAASATQADKINTYDTTPLLEKEFVNLHEDNASVGNGISQVDSQSHGTGSLFQPDPTDKKILKYNTVFKFPTHLATQPFNANRQLQHFMLFIYAHQILDDIITYLMKEIDDKLLKESFKRTQETIKKFYYNKLIEKFELKSIVPTINVYNLILKPPGNNRDNELHRLNPDLYYHLAYGGKKDKLKKFLQKSDKINSTGDKRENMFKIMSELLDLGKNGIPDEFRAENFIIENKIYYTGGFVLSNPDDSKEPFCLTTDGYSDDGKNDYSYSLITLFSTIDYFRRNMFNTISIISKFIKDMENNIKSTVSKRQVSILLNQTFRLQAYLYNGVENQGFDSNKVLADSIIYINQGTEPMQTTLRDQYQNICEQLVETFKNSIMIDVLLKTYQNKIKEDPSILKSIDFESSKNKLVLKRLVVLKYLYEKIIPEYMDYCDKEMSSRGRESQDENYNAVINNIFTNPDKIYSTDFAGTKIGRITTSIDKDNRVVGVLKNVYMKDVILKINEKIRGDIINLQTVYNEIVGSDVKQALIKGFFESQEMIRKELTGEVIEDVGYMGTMQLVDTVLKRTFWLDLAKRLGGLLLVPINRSSFASTEPVAFLNVIKIGYDGYFDYERSFKGFGKSRSDHVIIPDLVSTNFHSNLLNRKSLFMIDGKNIPRNIIYLTSGSNQDPINWRALPEKIIEELQTYNRYLAYGAPLGVNQSLNAKPELKMYGKSMFQKPPRLGNEMHGRPGGIRGVTPEHMSNLYMINENDQIPTILHKYIMEGKVMINEGTRIRPLRINDRDDLFLNNIRESVPKPVKPEIAAATQLNCQYVVYDYEIQNEYREAMIRKELYAILLANYSGRVTESFQSGVKGYKSQFEGLCKKYYIASADKTNYKQCSILLTRDQLNAKFY